jgi:hypothetical protein
MAYFLNTQSSFKTPQNLELHVHHLCFIKAKKCKLLSPCEGTTHHDSDGNGIPVTGRGGPQGCEDIEVPTFSPDNRLTDGGVFVSLTRRPSAFYH